jgi:hypothetical protein
MIAAHAIDDLLSKMDLAGFVKRSVHLPGLRRSYPCAAGYDLGGSAPRRSARRTVMHVHEQINTGIQSSMHCRRPVRGGGAADRLTESGSTPASISSPILLATYYRRSTIPTIPPARLSELKDVSSRESV